MKNLTAEVPCRPVPSCRVFARTDVGLVRSHNEDAVLADAARGIVVVADGMGGHAAGEIASRIAVETIDEAIPAARGRWPFARAERERAVLLEAVEAANERIRTEAAADAERAGMGTTVALVWLRAERAHVVHVGDSRVYRWRKGQLEPLTKDHAWTGEGGEQTNVLTRALGSEPTVSADHALHEIERGDVFLVCSDGLTRTLDDPMIAAALGQAKSGDAAAAGLIALARAAGAPDNVTVALAYC